MSPNRCALVVVLAAVALPRTVAAQAATASITLQEALERADRNSQRLVELQARVESSTAVEAGRRAAALPIVSALGGYTRTNHVDEFAVVMPSPPFRMVIYPDVPDNVHGRIDLQWPIYTGGRLTALERAAGAERAAATFDLAAVRADVRLEATRAFWALVTADRSREVLAHAVESTDAHVRELRARLDQGLIPPNEVLSAEAQGSRQRLLHIEAENLRGVAEADLRRVIGEDRPIHLEPVVPPEAPDPAAAVLADADALLAVARAERAERRALASRSDAAREREAAAAASRLPQVALGAGYDYARPNPRIFPRVDEWRGSWDASVNVGWTIWDSGRRRAEQAEAAAGVTAVAARAAEFDRQLIFEVEQHRLEASSTPVAIRTADDGLRAAVEARRVVGERFNAGVATSTEVLDADTALLMAQLERTRAVATAHLAAARLARAIGR